MKYHNITDLRIRYFFASTLFLLSLSACNQESINTKNNYNVLIVTFDTTRADHIASYGLKKDAQTPNVDNLANDGILYQNSLAPIPITLPSHSTIMTGKVPFTHGVRDNGLFKLAQNQLTLAEILSDRGWTTGAAIGSFPLTSQFGINQGFDFFNEHITQKYEDIFGDRTIPKDALFFDERNSAQVNEAFMPWLLETITKEDKPPFFAWLHYFDPHHPHEPPSPYSQSFVHDLYQGEIAFADESFGKIIEQLKKNDAYNNTLIIFTSDHGEGNGEHNESTHSLLVYNSTLHVPLIVKYPNQEFANSRIDQIVGSVDIFPTVLNELGIDIPDDIQGHILPTENLKSSNELYAETLSPRFSRGWGEQRALVKNDHKYIYGPIKELYNLKDDPHETNNLIQQKPELAQSMLSDLRDYIDENHVSDSEESNIEVDAKTLDTLRGLGYIQSTAGSVNTFEEKLDDSGEAPQKFVNTISIYSTAKQLLYKDKYIEAIRYLDSLLIEDKNNLAYIELKIQALMSLNNYDKVKEILEKLPDDSFGSITLEKRLFILATIALDQGDISTAKDLFLKSEKINHTIQGQYKLSLIAKTEGNLIQQQQHLNAILKIDTTLVKIIDELARSYDLSGDVLNAEKTFVLSIKNNPYNEKSHYNYGVYLNSMYDLYSAELQFRKAIDINKNYLIAYFALLEILISQNKLSETSSIYETMKNIDSENHLTKKAKILIENL